VLGCVVPSCVVPGCVVLGWVLPGCVVPGWVVPGWVVAVELSVYLYVKIISPTTICAMVVGAMIIL
jgi:hypothetical protein